MSSFLFGGNRGSVFFRAVFLIAVIAFIDARLRNELPLGFLYLLPMLMIGRVLLLWEIACISALCTLLTEIFDPFSWHFAIGISRDVLYFVAFFCAGFVVYEISRNRESTMQHLQEINRQQTARYEAEEQLKVLIESSPAAIITADSSGNVVMANEAAHRMLLIASGELIGRPIHRHFPSLFNVPRLASTQHLFRTVMQSRGHREDGEVFLADICFSTYRTDRGSRLAALILDASEELRTREEASLQQVMTGSRIALGAVAHEIRNICGAVQVVHQNLARNELLAHNKDFEALGTLIEGMSKIAAVDLHRTPDEACEIDLSSIIDDFKIIVGPSLTEYDVAVTWNISSNLPLIWTDRTTLIQVLLNLTRNSLRAMAHATQRCLSVSAWREANSVFVEFVDNGCGIANPELLFHPFQQGAQESGLGLYLSRALIRAFGGDLQYQPSLSGAAFRIEVRAVLREAPNE